LSDLLQSEPKIKLLEVEGARAPVLRVPVKSVTGVSHFGDSHKLSTNNIFRPYISRMQWLKCNGTQGNAVPPPPIYGSKRSPTSDCYNAREGTPPLSGAQT